jgi:hypothetical protein
MDLFEPVKKNGETLEKPPKAISEPVQEEESESQSDSIDTDALKLNFE